VYAGKKVSETNSNIIFCVSKARCRKWGKLQAFAKIDRARGATPIWDKKELSLGRLMSRAVLMRLGRKLVGHKATKNAFRENTTSANPGPGGNNVHSKKQGVEKRTSITGEGITNSVRSLRAQRRVSAQA